MDKQALLSEFIRGAPPDSLRRLAGQSRLRRVKRGEILMQAGERSAVMGFVAEGALALVQDLAHGSPHIMGVLLPGDEFGRIFNGPMPHSVESLSDCTVLEVERTTLEAELAANPEAEQAFIVSMLDELKAARAWVLIVSSPQVTERLAAFLLILHMRQRDRDGSPQAGPVTLRMPMSRKDLARCLGVRSESLSRAVQGLARSGIVEVVAPDILHVPDPDLLAEVAGHLPGLVPGDDAMPSFQRESLRR